MLAAGARAMRVVFFSECYQPIRNGVVASIDAAVRGLAARGVETIIVAPRYPRYHDDNHRVIRVPSFTFPVRPRYPIALPFARDWERRLAGTPVDLVHTHHPMSLGRAGVRFARTRGVPAVYTYHTPIEEYSHYLPLPRAWVRERARALTRAHAQSVACVIAPSRSAGEALQTLGVTTRIEVIPSGVDGRAAEGARLAPLRAEEGLPLDAPVLMYVGRLGREKNIGFLLEVVARLAPRVPVHLALVGEGALRETLMLRARQLGVRERVHFLGGRAHDMALRILAGADVFVSASTTETQGLALLEAMAVGVPVVAVDGPGVRETVGDSVAGVLVPHALDAFTEALEALLADGPRRQVMAGAARARAAEFSEARMAERLHTLYQELLDRAAPARLL